MLSFNIKVYLHGMRNKCGNSIHTFYMLSRFCEVRVSNGLCRAFNMVFQIALWNILLVP